MVNHAAQPKLFVFENFRCESEERALLQTQYSNFEIYLSNRRANLVLDKRDQLIEGSLQKFALLNALLIQLTLYYVYISLDNTSNTSFNCIERDSQVVKSLLPEALVLCESGDYFRGYYINNGLQEIEEADMVILVCVQKLHVVKNFEVDVLICEVEQLATE